MAAAAPAPGGNNILLLAALGIGVYWLMTRPAYAGSGVLYPTPAQNAQAYGNANEALKYQLGAGLISKGLGAIGNLIGGRGATGYTFRGEGTESNPYYAVTNDGLPYNPSSGSAVWDDIYLGNRGFAD